METRLDEYKMEDVIGELVEQFYLENLSYFNLKKEQGFFDQDEVVWYIENTPEDELTDNELVMLKGCEKIRNAVQDFEDLISINQIRIQLEFERISKYQYLSPENNSSRISSMGP